VAQQSTLKQQLAESELAQTLANTGAQLGSPAPVPTSPSSPHPVTSAITGLFAGVLVGLVLAFVVDYVDDTIVSREDAERAAYGLPTLAVTPPIPGWKNRQDAVVPTMNSPASPAAEAYRSLRTTLQFLAADRSLSAVLVTSPGTGEGKSTTLANLAVAFGRGGAQVCAVDGDLRCPRLHEFFHSAPEPGLTSVVVGDVPLSKAVRPLPEACISILTAGPVPKNPSELLGSSRMSGVLASLAAQFDMVLIDSPPVLPVTDAAALARHVDGVVIVVDAGNTKRRALTRAVEMLRQVNAPLLGLVVNRGAEEARYGYRYPYPATSRRAWRGRNKNNAQGPEVSTLPVGGGSDRDRDERAVVAAGAGAGG
jgi:capsular exopolysaccharide synthesis family protein